MISDPETKIREAHKLMKDAQSQIESSFWAMRFKPNWDGAASRFEKAATLYRTARAMDKAIEASLKCADAQYHCHSVFLAARALEQAGQMSTEINKHLEAADIYTRAAGMYMEHGDMSKAAEVIAKGAKGIETVDLDKSVQLYLQACDIYDNNPELYHYAQDIFRSLLSLLVRTSRWGEAIDMLHRTCKMHLHLDCKHNVWKAFLSMVILYLKMGDNVAAEQSHQKSLAVEGYFLVDEAKVANELLDSFEHNSPEELAACLRKQTFNFLDHEISRVARSLKVAGSEEGSNL
eukprot:gnl/Hemi2/18526_TR6124_c0_g1_i1.p1 gnl/Hemi2/18526_TR6124_c0_g1~~gnl/Hemi2/18526_TR6124_c0_g1_i1.p1  ORF type:complete len:291 (+),score=91.59 gnl/Hemi2/18526_TR6124_c0_g1_i1:146-1018(+)